MSLLNLCPMIRMYETAVSGAPLVGGKVYTAQPGTVAGPSQSFPKATYADGTGAVANTNPVILDGSGKADIWLNGNYSIAVYDANNVLIESVSNVAPQNILSGSDNVSFYDATLATINTTIPSANDTSATPNVIIKTDNSANLVVITPASGTILGQPTYSLYLGNESVRLIPEPLTNDWKKDNVTVLAPTTVKIASDNIQFYDSTSSPVVPLPSANDANAIPSVIIKTDDAGSITIIPSSGTILGEASYVIYGKNESVRLVPQASTNDWKKGA